MGITTEITKRLSKASFGQDTEGHSVDIYTLTNENGVVAKVITYGAILTELWVPDRLGKAANVVLGFDSLKPYETNKPYFGATIGRYANRIAFAKFSLDGRNYELNANSADHTLHGGNRGFSKRHWHAKPATDPEVASVQFTYSSPDMEEGYPGNLTATVAYTLTPDNELKLTYAATTDQATPVNLTNHSYFNLSGASTETILDHFLQIHAKSYLPAKGYIPTGEIAEVKDTPFDFTEPKQIKRDINQLSLGYDLNYVMENPAEKVIEAAHVRDASSGRNMHMLTDQPGVQLYTSNHLDGTISGIGGAYNQYGAVCLEAQKFPDSVHHSHFPDAILRPGQTYKQTTIYKFSWE